MKVQSANRPLSDSNRLLAAIIDSSDDAVISKTIDGVITTWNRGAERIFGYSADEMVGQPIALLAAAGHEDEMPALLQRLRRGERVDHFETVRRHKDGSDVLVSLTVSPIYDDSGEIAGASKIARDITAARRAADALKLAELRLQEQHRELLHAARLGELGQMAATLAHELNQPLSGIANYLNAGQRLLAADDPNSRAKLAEALQRASDQVRRAAEIGRRLRSYAKPTEGQMQPESMAEMLEEAAALAAIDAGQRGVQVELFTSGEPDVVLADRIEVQQVLLNLIRNAIEAMDNRPRRELRLSTVTLNEGGIEVAVADTGPGISSEIRDRLFQPFVTTKDNGMGIGLSICRRIVEAHGGSLRAEDGDGGGTIFRLTLPSANQA